MKYCPKCDQDLPDDAFYDPARSTCKECKKERGRVGYKARKASFRGYKLCACGCGELIPATDAKGQPRAFADHHHQHRSDIAEVLRYIKKANQRTRFHIEMCCHLGKAEAGRILKDLSSTGDIYQLGRGDWAAREPYKRGIP